MLVVDDDPISAAAAASTLHAHGYQVTTAAGGEECLRSAREHRPDVILLDANMPVMNGFETARKLGEEPRTSGIPIIMLTALQGREHRLQALRAGAIDFLSKPVDPEELSAKVQGLSRLKSYNDAMRRRRDELGQTLVDQGSKLQSTLETLARFVPPEFLEQLGVEDFTGLTLGKSVRRETSILFSDIRSFTAMAEKMTPEDTFRFLNSYLRRMNPFVWENGGFIDKYIGDAIMALFPRGAESALNAAVSMLGHLSIYNEHRASVGYPPVRIGVGLHAGDVSLGVIGHERFMQGTAISDAVNLASRLEELTKSYGVSLVVSSNLIFGLQDPNRFSYRFLDRLVIRGRTEPVSVFEVLDERTSDNVEQKLRTKPEFERAAYAFHAGEMGDALARFDALGSEPLPDPTVEFYRQRCLRAIKLGVARDIESS